MAQMGGWAVLDHALRDSMVADATVRLGYASYLSAWALMNSGTAESNYGYWYGGKDNDGGAGGGFEPAAMSQTWLGQPNYRGSWYYSSEEDLGFCGALRSARVVVADDPIFGRFCFGGVMHPGSTDTVTISPRDGVRRRFSLLTGQRHLEMEVTGARFQKDRSIQIDAHGSDCTLQLERHPLASGRVRIVVAGLASGAYRVQTAADDKLLQSDGTTLLEFEMPATTLTVTLRAA